MWSSSDRAEIDANGIDSPSQKDWRFWSIIACLSITAVLASIDGTIIATSLPSIVDDLSGGEKYVWVVGSYFLARYVSAQARIGLHSLVHKN